MEGRGNSLQVMRYNDVDSLLERCERVLRSQEALNNNLIQLLLLIANKSEVLQPPYFFGTVEKNGVPIGCYAHASPDGLVITDMPTDAISPLCEAIVAEANIPARIVGEPAFIGGLVEEILQRKKREASVSSKWKVYRLDRVTKLDSPSPGFLRLGTSDDRALVEQWGYAYGDEKPSFLNVHDFLLGKLDSGELYLWDDLNPRTIITTSGSEMNARRISSVFTPREFRSKGYATTGVTATSQLLLDQGAEYVVLTAGLGEPAARIYKRIGFLPVGDRQSFMIKAPTDR